MFFVPLIYSQNTSSEHAEHTVFLIKDYEIISRCNMLEF